MEDEGQLPSWNFSSKKNVADIQRFGRVPRQKLMLKKGLKEEKHHIINSTYEKETGFRESIDMKDSEFDQFALRPRHGRRATKNADEYILCNKIGNPAYQYNFDREKPTHRALVSHDSDKCDNSKALKSIRRRSDEPSPILCDFRKVSEMKILVSLFYFADNFDLPFLFSK